MSTSNGELRVFPQQARNTRARNFRSIYQSENYLGLKLETKFQRRFYGKYNFSISYTVLETNEDSRMLQNCYIMHYIIPYFLYFALKEQDTLWYTIYSNHLISHFVGREITDLSWNRKPMLTFFMSVMFVAAVYRKS
jgi:hypothetical protein